MRVTLTVIDGPHAGQVFTFGSHDTFLVGRSKRAHFRLPTKDRFFSRVHFLVEVNPPQCRLMDMDSRNGTFVNGQRVEKADLKDKDQIRAGHTVLRVHVEEGAAVPTPLSVEPIPVAIEEEPQSLPVVEVSPPSLAPRLCRACEAALPTSLPAAKPARLCPACLALIRNHEQPLKGFHIIRSLGQGAMGVVYLAVRASDDSLVALKTVIPAVAGTSVQVERFLRESDILRQLQHTNIVAFRESGECGGKFFFAMDYVRGPDASQLLRNEGPLALPRRRPGVSTPGSPRLCARPRLRPPRHQAG